MKRERKEHDKQNCWFIGGGRIVRIFLEGWKRGEALPAKIVVSDCNAETLAKLKAQFPGVETAPGNSAAAAQDIVFLAVHPPVMAEVAAGIKGSLKPGRWWCRSRPSSPIAKLTELLGGFARLARVIPNAPSVVDCGLQSGGIWRGAECGGEKRKLPTCLRRWASVPKWRSRSWKATRC